MTSYFIYENKNEWFIQENSYVTELTYLIETIAGPFKTETEAADALQTLTIPTN